MAESAFYVFILSVFIAALTHSLPCFHSSSVFASHTPNTVIEYYLFPGI
jgi:hypothetical protein